MEPQELYGLPLERFTEERNALARDLRKAGHRDEAKRVAQLRKPSLAAWAVNQLVRTQRRDVDALFGAGDALRDAQADLLAGRGNADALREAVEGERVTREQLTGTARGLLSSEGHELSPATLAKVSDTLNAAALDESARAEVQDGCLVQELHHVGLGSLEPVAPSRHKSRRPTKEPGSRGAGRQANRPAQAEVEAARKAEAQARRSAERTERAAAAARERRDRAAQALRQAEEAVRDAERESAGAKRAVADAARKLQKLRSRQN